MICLRKLLLLSFVLLIAVGHAACDRTPDSNEALAPGAGLVPIDDVQIHYEISGDGIPLILLHGGLGHAGHWEQQIPELSERYRVVAFDSRGHGRSTYAEKPFTQSLLASDVMAVMDALDIDKAHILGWSDGANIGLDLAVNHPERLLKVITYGGNFNPSGVRSDVSENEAFTRYVESSAADYQRLSPNPERWEPLLVNVSNMWATEPHFSPEELGGITIPVLILTGENDEAIHTDHTRELAGLIPTAKLTLINGTGHFAHWDKPDEFNSITLEFLEDQERGIITATETLGVIGGVAS